MSVQGFTMKNISEQIAAVEREINMRYRVYPSWVAKNRLSQAKADHEIEAMESVLETLRALKSAIPCDNITIGATATAKWHRLIEACGQEQGEMF